MSRTTPEKASRSFAKALDGIGQSKRESKAESGLKCDRSGHAKSDKLHSYSSLNNFQSQAKQYFEYVKEEHGTLKGNVNNDTLTDYLKSRLDSGEIKESTANTYLSVLSNISIAQEHLGIAPTIDVREVGGNLNDLGHDLGREYADRSYSNPVELVGAMERNTEYGLSAALQYEYGLRADDATSSEKWRITESGTLEISGSKNGVTYETAPLSDEMRSRVESAIESGYSPSYSGYYNNLREQAGEEWNGSHGLRYNFAQERMDELKDQGYSYREALETVSLEMGHSRAGITEHYLPRE